MPSEEQLTRALDDLAARLPVRPRWIASLLAEARGKGRIRFTNSGAIVVTDHHGQPLTSSDPLGALVQEIMNTGGPEGRPVPDEFRGESQLGASHYDQIRAEARASLEQKGYVRKASG